MHTSLQPSRLTISGVLFICKLGGEDRQEEAGLNWCLSASSRLEKRACKAFSPALAAPLYHDVQLTVSKIGARHAEFHLQTSQKQQ